MNRQPATNKTKAVVLMTAIRSENSWTVAAPISGTGTIPANAPMTTAYPITLTTAVTWRG